MEILLSFNPSRGIAIIQTPPQADGDFDRLLFQSLTRDSNHSNSAARVAVAARAGFNPSRGIAIIQTDDDIVGMG